MRPPWKMRRRVVFGTLFLCAVVILRFSFMSTDGVDPELAKLIVLGAYGLAGTTIGAYVFGATWDDRNVMSLIGEKAYAAPALPEGWPPDIVAPETDRPWPPQPSPPFEYRNAP